MRRFACALAGALAIAIASLLAAGCGGSNDEGAQSLRVGYAFGNDAGDTGDMLAYERLRKAGVAVDLADTGGSENAVAALRKGSIDIAAISQESLVQAIDQGAPVVGIVGQNMASETQLVARGIDSAEGLVGKKVATGKGPAGVALIALTEQKAGLDDGALGDRVVPESSARSVALTNGRLQAATLDGSDAIRLAHRLSDLHVISRLADLAGVTAPITFVTRPDFAEKHPQLVQQFVTEITGAGETLYGDGGRKEFLRVGGEDALKDDSPAVAGEIYDYYRTLGVWPRAAQPITEEQYNRTMAFYRSNDGLEADVPFAQAWNLDFWSNT